MSLSLHTPEAPWPDKATAWRAIVTDVRQTGKALRLRIRTVSYAEGGRWINREDDAGIIGRQTMISVMHDTLNPEPVHTGEAILFYGKIEPPRKTGNPYAFDYGTWLKRQGIAGEALVFTRWQKLPAQETERLLRRQPLPVRLSMKFLQWRNLLLEQFDHFSIDDEDRAVLSSLTLGSRYHLTSSLRHTYSTVGGSHVLALSGLHLGILVTFLLILLRPLRRRGAACVLTLILIWSFVLLTGMSTSLLRAAVMYTVWALIMLQNRASNGLNALGLAAVLLLIFSPQSLFDIGFELSFLAVLSILLLYPVYSKIRPEQKGWRLICDFIYVAAAAQIGTAPLAAYAFNILPLTVLLTNLIVVPCAYVLLGGTLGYFLFMGFPPVKGLLAHVLSGTVHFMNTGLASLSHLPHAAVPVYPGAYETLIFYLFILTIVIFISVPRRRTLTAAIVAFFLLAGTDIYERNVNKPDPQIVFYNSPACPVVQFIANRQRSWIWADPHDSLRLDETLNRVAARFWGRCRIDTPRLIVKTLHEPELKAKNEEFHFGRLSVVILSDDRWKHRRLSRPLPADYLYITRGFRGRFESIGFRPRTVILDAGLPEWQRRSIIRQCQACHIACHDIRRQGALIVKLDQK